MNILFDHLIFSWQRYGGISRYLSELAAGLARRDDCTVAIVAAFHTNEYLRHADQSYVWGPYFNPQIPGAGQIRRLCQKMLLPIQYALNANADIVHETYYSVAPIGRGQFRVLTVHDMIHELFTDQFRNGASVIEAKRACVSRADHVICVSESTRQDLIRLLDVDPHKTSVVYHGHTLARSASETSDAISGIKRPYLLYVGARAPGYKNFMTFCKAVASSPVLKKEFDIIAFGGGDFLDTERTVLQKLGLREQTHSVSGDDDLLGAYYRCAALLVYPSLYEGFGIPPLEAMSLDCPVVCSNTSSIPEVVGEAGVYFDPCSVDSMREAIERVTNSTELRTELVHKGRERLKMFSWERCVNETAEIYKAVLGRGSRA